MTFNENVRRIRIMYHNMSPTGDPSASVCIRSFVGIVGSNPARRHGCLSLVSAVCCQVEVSASGRSLVQRSPTERGVSI